MKVDLNLFEPRSYQIPPMAAFWKGYKRILCIMPRRAGKDVFAFNLMIRSAIRKVGVYYYIFPTFAQAKRVIWDSITNDGQRFLDYIPEALIESKNSQELKIRLKNGSLIALVGSDNYDALMGSNPRGCVFSEYALQDPRAYQYIRPILLANDGWAIFISTPRGKNHLYDLYNIAKELPSWFVWRLTVDETKHISREAIERERTEGLISEDLIQQEYYCSFDLGVEGAYYIKYMDRNRIHGQISNVPWQPMFKVHTAWDIGVRDSTAIIFFQQVGTNIHIIDCYERSKEGLEHYIQVLASKSYKYGHHIGPHDLAVQEFGSGITRVEKARQLGIEFTIASDHSIMDGIEAVRSTLPRVYIDESNCKTLIKALENYRQEYDSKRKVYKQNPLHDIHSHFADSMRYLCVSLPKTRDGMSQEDVDRLREQAYYGEKANMPRFFSGEFDQQGGLNGI